VTGRLLDRDGVINRAIVRQWQAIRRGVAGTARNSAGRAGSARAPPRLRLSEYRSGPISLTSRRKDSAPAVEEITRTFERIPIDALKICYHIEADSCTCRKPRPGMRLKRHASSRSPRKKLAGW